MGQALAPRLLADGHELVGFARNPARADGGAPGAPDGPGVPGVPVVRGDALTGAGLAEAMEGVEVAYYLIHAMEPSADGDFAAREQLAAANVVAAARAAGVRRIVYLGGVLPAGREPSPHLASRLAVERALLAGVEDSVALRASIVIGAGSSSFRFLVRLVERLRVMAVPAWRHNRTQPIDIRDVVEYLARAATLEAAGGRSLDIAGPDVVTYFELIDRIRDALLVDRFTIGLGFNITPVASVLAARVAGAEHALVGPLMQGLDGDLLPRDERARELFALRPHSLDAALERALRDWESAEPLRAR